jgi:hypothetical protein
MLSRISCGVMQSLPFVEEAVTAAEGVAVKMRL